MKEMPVDMLIKITKFRASQLIIRGDLKVSLFIVRLRNIVCHSIINISLLILFSPSATAGPIKAGQEAPWFAGWSGSGQVLNQHHVLSKKHKNNVLVFTASWCPASSRRP